MIKCVPVVVAFSEKIISFKVNILDAKPCTAPHTLYGGGNGVIADDIGEASLILKRATLSDEAKVLYLDGYIKRGSGCEFCVKTEKEIITACKKASEAIWG